MPFRSSRSTREIIYINIEKSSQLASVHGAHFARPIIGEDDKAFKGSAAIFNEIFCLMTKFLINSWYRQIPRFLIIEHSGMVKYKGNNI